MIYLSDLSSLSRSSESWLRKQLKAQLTTADRADTTVLLHPNAASLDAAKVAQLQSALDQPDVRFEAIETLRLLIEQITLTPDTKAPEGLRTELHGDLAMILSLTSSPIAYSLLLLSPYARKLNPQEKI